jgi:dienelactone hydrolase
MRRLPVIALALLLTGCGAGPAGRAAPLDGAAASPAATATTGPQETVHFAATDGVALTGVRFGTAGATLVILSNMGDNDPRPWQAFAPRLAERGYPVLTYSFRYPLRTNSFTPAMAAATVPDLLGAVAYARQSGATHIVLIGASLGGITVGKVAAQVGADAVAILSAEQDLVGYGLAVSPAELAGLTMPKLFVASEQDTNTGFGLTRSFFQNAPEPKEFQTYPGGTHGVGLFATAHGDDLRRRLLGFVQANTPGQTGGPILPVQHEHQQRAEGEQLGRGEPQS